MTSHLTHIVMTSYLCLSAGSPVCLPGVQDLRVLHAQLRRLEVQEVKEVLHGLGQRLASGDSKDGVEQIVHVRLQDTLWM